MDVATTMHRIIVMSRSNPGWGGSFQYAEAILSALSKLSEKQKILFLYYDEAWDSIARNLPFKSRRVAQKYPFFIRVICKLLRIGNKIFQRQYLQDYLTLDPILHCIKHSDATICICLEQEYIPLHDQIKVIGPIHDLMHRYEGRFPEVADEYDIRERLFGNHAKTAAAILVDSPLGKQHVMESYGTSSDRIHVLPFIPGLKQDSPLQRPKELPENITPFIFYPAQFWLHKNHCAIIEALALLQPKYKFHCIFTGTTDKGAYPAIKHTIEQYKLREYIHILGYRPTEELAWLYKNAFAMVMPTFFGPTNIPPLEAQQMGCPVIVSDVYAMPWQLGDGALYIDPHKPEQIATAVESLMDNPELRQALIDKGFKKVAKWNKGLFETEFLRIVKGVVA